MDKTMEKEYKWRADEKLLGQALLWASSRIGSQSRTINMESSYFDTADGLLKEHQAALRLRRENDRSVCCMSCATWIRRTACVPTRSTSARRSLCLTVCADCPNLVHRTTCASGRWQPTCRKSARFRSAGVRFCCRRTTPCAKWRLTKANCVITVKRRRCARSNLSMSQAVRIPSTRLPQSWRSSLTSWLSRPASWRERWRCNFRFTNRFLYLIIRTATGE
ncbi:CYTH domain-containing protein [Agathobaculum butyriciproducens]|nr:CYTH domain-containing protein [Agathobaculum butyriciproducens]